MPEMLAHPLGRLICLAGSDWREQMQHRPEEVVRYTVEQNGGDYTTTVIDLLSLFGRQQLTDRARCEIRQALLGQGVGTDPDLLTIDRSEAVRLFLLESASTWPSPLRSPIRRRGGATDFAPGRGRAGPHTPSSGC